MVSNRHWEVKRGSELIPAHGIARVGSHKYRKSVRRCDCVQVRELTEARLLAGIHLVRVHSAVQLSSAVSELPAYLASNPQVTCSCIAV